MSDFKKYLMRFDPDDFSFRLANGFDEKTFEEFLSVYAQIFRPINRELFEWYDKLSGQNYWGIIYDKAHALVGMYGLLNISLNFNGRKTDGYLCHNVGITKEHGGKGLFQYIAEKTITAVLKNDGILLGFPNRAAVKGHTRIGWKSIGEVAFYSLNPKNIELSPISKDYTFQEVDSFNDSIDQLLTGTYPKISFSTYKDSNYLNWRCRRPESTYQRYLIYKQTELEGYAIYKEYQDGSISKLHLVDFLAKDTTSIQEIINFSKSLLSKGEYDLFNTWIPEGTIYANTFKKNGFIMMEEDYKSPVITFTMGTEALTKSIASDKVFLTLFDNDVI